MNKSKLIFREIERNQDKKLNVLLNPIHEAWESCLAKTEHNFFAYNFPGSKGWNTKFRPIPSNYTLLNGEGLGQLLPHVSIDLVLTGSKFGSYQNLAPIANYLGIPIISVEHTLPMREWGPNMMDKIHQMNGKINVFISDYSRREWGYENDPNSRIVHHGIETDIFKPGNEERQNRVFSCVNDFIQRDYCCGYYSWTRITEGLPTLLLGDTKGLSLPAESTAKLAETYRTSRIFLNTSTLSPVPTVLLEAMSSGCAVVSTSNCMVPEIIEHGIDGFLSNDEKELRDYIELLIRDGELATKLGQNARKKVENMFSLEKFVQNWNNLFWSVL